MSDIEVDASVHEDVSAYNVIPKDIAAEAGTVKLFNKWDYEVEVRDISLTYVNQIRNWR